MRKSTKKNLRFWVKMDEEKTKYFWDYSIGEQVTVQLKENQFYTGTVISVSYGNCLHIRFEENNKSYVHQVHPVFVQHKRKRQKADKIIPVWLQLCMDYLGIQKSSWVEIHTLERSWMIHTNDPNMYFQEFNDEKLKKKIENMIKELVGPFNGNEFMNWISEYAVITGSTLLALCHDYDPFDANGWNSVNIHILTHDLKGCDRSLNVVCYGPCKCSSYPLYRNEESHYDNPLPYSIRSYKYQLPKRNQNHSTVVLNVVEVETLDKNLHDFSVRYSDIDILANTCNGKLLQFGDGSILARDRIACLLGKWNPLIRHTPDRVESRFIKYRCRRGVTIDMCSQK